MELPVEILKILKIRRCTKFVLEYCCNILALVGIVELEASQ